MVDLDAKLTLAMNSKTEQSENPDQAGWKGLALIAGLVIIFSVGTGYGIHSVVNDWHLREQLSKNGSDTRATIVDFYKTTRGLKLRLGVCDITYEYSVAGTTYRNREDISEHRCGGLSEHVSTIAIRYVATAPGKARIRDNFQSTFDDLVNALALLVALGISVALLLAFVSEWRFQRRNRAQSRNHA